MSKVPSPKDNAHLLETTLSSEVVFKGRFLKIKRDEVQLANGQKSFREYINHPGAAMVIPEVAPGLLLFVRQYRHAVKRLFIEFPAGKRDADESTFETAQRELQEESGYSANTLKFLCPIHPVIGYADEQIDLYLAQGLVHVGQKLDHGENLEAFEMKIDEAMSLVHSGQITDVKTIIGIFWYDKYLKSGW